MMLQKLDQWHKTRGGYFLFGLIELGITYYFASLAISRGTWWWYVLTLIFFVGTLQNAVKLIGALLHAKKLR